MRLSKTSLRTLLVLLAIQAVLFAQAPAVTAVLNSASGDARLSPGVLAQVYYTPLTARDLQHSTANLPGWPFNETVTIQVGGRKAWVISTSRVQGDPGGIASVLLPRESTPGATTLTITTSAGSSAPFRIQLAAYAPGLYPVDSVCSSRKEVASVNAVGLGATNPPVSTFDFIPSGQNYTTSAQPGITIAGVPAEIVSSAAYPYWGDYQVFFRPAPETPEGFQPLSLTIGGVTSNTVNVLVGPENRLTAGGKSTRAAPESLVTINACSVPLATGEYSADSKNPPTTLGGTTVRITDSAGIDRLAPLYDVSSSQVKYVVPRDVANGAAHVTVTAADGSTTVAPLEVASVEPGLFCTEVCGWTPAPKGYLVRVRDGVETEEPIEPGAHEISQIDLGPDTDQVYLVMLGTGWRNRSSLANVSVKFGDLEAPVQYAGPQGDYAGLDQVKVLLPRWPAGHTSQEEGVQVWLTVDGKLANPLFLDFR